MSSEKLSRVGELAETPAKSLALINGDGVAYSVQESIVRIWDEFQGDTPEEVAERLAKEEGLNLEELRGPVSVIANKLEEVGLLVPTPDE